MSENVSDLRTIDQHISNSGIVRITFRSWSWVLSCVRRSRQRWQIFCCIVVFSWLFQSSSSSSPVLQPDKTQINNLYKKMFRDEIFQWNVEKSPHQCLEWCMVISSWSGLWGSLLPWESVLALCQLWPGNREPCLQAVEQSAPQSDSPEQTRWPRPRVESQSRTSSTEHERKLN